ncbi:MAG: hypothetical protein FWE06_05915 [Oscillospiraceae bacterium]|nr:hypothetical protein [Oscillospiraceae bacterium]
MLRKLLKYDLLYGYKVYILCAIVTLFYGVTMGTLMANGDSFLHRGGLIGGLTLLFVQFLPFGIAIATVVLIIRSYHQGLFGHQGYLTMTLPVKPFNILLSKTLTALMWVNLIGLAVIVSIIIMRLYLDAQQVDYVLSNIDWLEWASLVLMLNLILLNVLQAVYTAISAGFVAMRKLPRWIGAGIAIVSIVIVQSLTFTGLGRLLDGRFIGQFNGDWGIYRWSDAYYTICCDVEGFSTIDGRMTAYIDLNLTIITAVFAVGLFVLNHWLVKRKVNLD